MSLRAQLVVDYNTFSWPSLKRRQSVKRISVKRTTEDGVDMALLQTVMLTADIATMWDQSAHNAGFVAVRPTWYGRCVYEMMQRKARTSKKVDDQTALNGAIGYLERRYGRKGFTAVSLDVHRYVCGIDYFETSRAEWPSPVSTSSADDVLRSGCRSDTMSCPVVVHNNWIVSLEAKIYRFKEHLMWMYDKGGLNLSVCGCEIPRVSKNEATFIFFTIT